MINIMRGSNMPIILNFNIDTKVASISLFSDNNYSVRIDHWTQDDIFIKDNFLIIPLTEAQTLKYPVGIGHLEIKYLKDNGIVAFVDSTSVLIRRPQDLSALSPVEIDYENISIEELLEITNLDDEDEPIVAITFEEIDEMFED